MHADRGFMKRNTAGSWFGYWFAVIILGIIFGGVFVYIVNQIDNVAKIYKTLDDNDILTKTQTKNLDFVVTAVVFTLGIIFGMRGCHKILAHASQNASRLMLIVSAL